MERKHFNKIISVAIVIFISLILSSCSEKKQSYPEGFAILEGDAYSEYVISDENGNEYVWIPCDDPQRYDFDNDRFVKENEVIDRIYYGEEVPDSITYGTEYDIGKFINSVKDNGGFFISRYEIGEGNVSKNEAEPIVNITRDEAFYICNSLYDQKEITSTLINSYAWDAAALYEIAGGKYIEHLGDGVSEFTTEHSVVGFYDDDGDVVVRGNNSSDEKSDCSIRDYNFTNTKNDHTGFRAIIYYK